MNKFQKLYEAVIDIINWAEYQNHITEDAANILIENITEEKEEIEKTCADPNSQETAEQEGAEKH